MFLWKVTSPVLEAEPEPAVDETEVKLEETAEEEEVAVEDDDVRDNWYDDLNDDVKDNWDESSDEEAEEGTFLLIFVNFSQLSRVVCLCSRSWKLSMTYKVGGWK